MSSRFDIVSTPLLGLKVVQRKAIEDERGYLQRMFCSEELQCLTSGVPIVQINHTLTKRVGTVRGLHFQHPPHAEMKFVSCLRGQVFDVAVDVRRDSSTFLAWHGEVLSAENRRTMFVPAGFAHGFQALTSDCELLYLITAAFEPRAESGLNAQDSRLGIRWPQAISERSPRDISHPMLTPDFQGLVL